MRTAMGSAVRQSIVFAGSSRKRAHWMGIHDAHMLGVRIHAAVAFPERNVNTHHGMLAIAYIHFVHDSIFRPQLTERRLTQIPNRLKSKSIPTSTLTSIHPSHHTRSTSSHILGDHGDQDNFSPWRSSAHVEA